MSEMGTVIKSTGSWYILRTEEGHTLQSRIRGKFRLDGKKLTNPVAVGDVVSFDREAGEEKVGIITHIHDRKNYVVRQSPRQKHALHLLAANVDQVVLVSTIKSPDLKPGFIDRFLLMTEGHDIPVIIVINKADLLEPEDLDIYGGLEFIYGRIGYEVLLTSATAGRGVETLKEKLKDKATLISGQSGVGKSSLLNSLQPNLGLRTSEISDASGKGAHTTTHAEMFELEFGGFIIDTPGIKNLSFNNLTIQDVAHNFREFFELSHECKFNNCTHRNEPGCAVKNGIEEGLVSELRYMNYLQILDEIDAQNYWERINY